MITNLQKTYESANYPPANLAGSAADVARLDIVQTGTIKKVSAIVGANVSGDVVFAVYLNGAVQTGAALTILSGTKTGASAAVTIAVTIGDEIVLRRVSGTIAAPVSLVVSFDDGISSGGGSGGVDAAPKTPNLYDDEFEGAALSSNWTKLLTSVISENYSDRVKSAYLVSLAANDNLRLEKDFTPTGDFSVTLAGWVLGITNYSGIDIFIRDGGATTEDPEIPDPTQHNNDYWLTSNYADGFKAEIHRRAAGGSRNYTVNTYSSTAFMTAYDKVYMHVQRVGGGWSFYVSKNGIVWLPLLLASSAHNFTPTKLMIAIRGNSSFPINGGFDWVRVNWLFL